MIAGNNALSLLTFTMQFIPYKLANTRPLDSLPNLYIEHAAAVGNRDSFSMSYKCDG